MGSRENQSKFREAAGTSVGQGASGNWAGESSGRRVWAMGSNASGKQEYVSKAAGMCLRKRGAGGAHTPALRDAALREAEEDAPGWVGWA